MLLTLIAIIFFTTSGQAFDSQCNNKDIIQYDSRGKQCAKEMLHSDQGTFYTNPLKSETNNSSAFEWLFVPIPYDNPASFMSIFLSLLTVVPTSSFLHFHVPTNATNTTTGLRIHYDSHQTSLNDVTIAHVPAMTATTTATMTNVTATRIATTKALQYQLTWAQKTISPSILHPTKNAANYATPRNLLLFHIQNNTAITISSLLLPHFKRSATTMATCIQSLQLIVICEIIPVSEGAQQAPPANILQKSKLIVDVETGANAPPHWSNLHLISKQLIDIFESKIFRHFHKDCKKICDGDQDIPNDNGLLGLSGIVRHNGIVGSSNSITNLIGLVGLIGHLWNNSSFWGSTTRCSSHHYSEIQVDCWYLNRS
jgi:hypothetical protein